MPSPTEPPIPARRRTAGPLLRSGDTADAVIEALREDNPGSELLIRDHGGYLRIEGENGLLLRRETAERALGRPFRMQEIELLMAGYSGMIAVTEESARWYFRHETRTPGPDGGEAR